MSLLLYLPLVLIAVVYFVKCYFTRTFGYWKKRNVKGPQPQAFFGNLKDSTLRKKTAFEVLKDIYLDYPNEKVVGIFRMTTPALIVRDPEIIKSIFIKDFDNFQDRGVEFSTKGLGVNLFHADGESWRLLRNRFSPLFSSGKLRKMFYLMIQNCESFIQHMETVIMDQKECEVHHLFEKYTVSVIGSCAFGADLKTLEESNDENIFIKMGNILFTTTFANELDMMFPGILKKLKLSLFPAIIQTFFDELVRDITREREGKPFTRGDFMDLLLELKEQKLTTNTVNGKELHLEITSEVIAAQAFVFFAAGFETSSGTMSFLFYELAKNQDIQEKLKQDILETVNKHQGKITYESIQDMKYLNMVLSETLRKYPSVDPIQRRTINNYKVPGTDLVLERGSIVLISTSGLHYDPKYFPEPEKFDPERFSPENISKIPSNAYMPFGDGPRNCIGFRFAKLQIGLALANIVLKYKVEPSENTTKKIELSPKRLTPKTRGGLFLRFIKRTD